MRTSADVILWIGLPVLVLAIGIAKYRHRIWTVFTRVRADFFATLTFTPTVVTGDVLPGPQPHASDLVAFLTGRFTIPDALKHHSRPFNNIRCSRCQEENPDFFLMCEHCHEAVQRIPPMYFAVLFGALLVVTAVVPRMNSGPTVTWMLTLLLAVTGVVFLELSLRQRNRREKWWFLAYWVCSLGIALLFAFPIVSISADFVPRILVGINGVFVVLLGYKGWIFANGQKFRKSTCLIIISIFLTIIISPIVVVIPSLCDTGVESVVCWIYRLRIIILFAYITFVILSVALIAAMKDPLLKNPQVTAAEQSYLVFTRSFVHSVSLLRPFGEFAWGTVKVSFETWLVPYFGPLAGWLIFMLFSYLVAESAIEIVYETGSIKSVIIVIVGPLAMIGAWGFVLLTLLRISETRLLFLNILRGGMIVVTISCVTVFVWVVLVKLMSYVAAMPPEWSAPYRNLSWNILAVFFPVVPIFIYHFYTRFRRIRNGEANGQLTARAERAGAELQIVRRKILNILQQRSSRGSKS